MDKKKDLWIGYYFDGEDMKDWHFISNGTRKDLKQEFKEVLKDEFDVEIELSDIEGVYKITEAYDYTDDKVYRIKLMSK